MPFEISIYKMPPPHIDNGYEMRYGYWENYVAIIYLDLISCVNQ